MSALTRGAGDSLQHVRFAAGAGDGHVLYDAGGGAGDSLPLHHVSNPLHLGTSPVTGFCLFGG